MPYQVRVIFRLSALGGGQDAYYWINLNEEQLRSRIVDPWDRGQKMSWNGQTVESTVVDRLSVYQTEGELPREAVGGGNTFNQLTRDGDDQTNVWITGAAGSLAPVGGRKDAIASPLKDPRRVMVVHGRNTAARIAMFTFLRTIGLQPIEWERAVAETGMASPHNLDAVQAAMGIAQAVVVILTAEDEARLLEALDGSAEEKELRGQPRLNVILEAGLAMGVDRAHTVLVELGEIRGASDFDGLNVVRLTNEPGRREALRSRLRNAGCDIDDSATDWTTAAAGGDFDAAVAEDG